jgi:hypothetical protein
MPGTGLMYEPATNLNLGPGAGNEVGNFPINRVSQPRQVRPEPVTSQQRRLCVNRTIFPVTDNPIRAYAGR